MVDEIEVPLLTTVVKSFLDSTHYKFNFIDPGTEGGFHIYWNEKQWDIKDDNVDPLSIYLYVEKPERYMNGVDDFITATIAKSLDKTVWWVYSFQDGFYGRTNKSTSISGHVLGRRFRRAYLHV